MTLKQALLAIRIELNKHKAPELSLVEFNYFINKAVNQYTNLIYNNIEVNQQTTDDIRVLKSTAKLAPTKIKDNIEDWLTFDTSDMIDQYSAINMGEGVKYEVDLPIDYLHLLNCICIFQANKPIDCYPKGSLLIKRATRLTADQWGMVLDNVFNRPSVYNPYFYIQNINTNFRSSDPTQQVAPYNPIRIDDHDENLWHGVDFIGTSSNKDSEAYKVYSNGFYATTWAIKSRMGDAFKLIQISATGEKPENAKFYELNRGGFDLNNPDSWTSSVEIKTETDPVTKRSYLTYQGEEIVSLAEEPKGSTYYVKPQFIYPDSKNTVSYSPNLEGNASSNFPRTFKLDLRGNGVPDTNVSMVEKPTASRLGNNTLVRMEIRVDSDDVFELVQVKVDYLKVPLKLRLTQELLMLTSDTSQILEFPEYVNQEIINLATKLIMEHNSDQRLATHMQVSQSIAPVGQATK